jgi:4,5-dihydroxyphthalate decarboxylase
MRLDLHGEAKITPIGADATLSKMLSAGELDAVISPRAPSAHNGTKTVRLFPDYRQAEEAYYRKTKLFPIMHVIGIRRALAERHPWLPVNVYTAFLKAKEIAVGELTRVDTPQAAHPWMSDEISRVKALMGEDYWPYGIDKNRHELDTFNRYAEADGLTNGPVPLESLFAPATFDQFNF